MNGVPIPQVSTHTLGWYLTTHCLEWPWQRFQCIQHVRADAGPGILRRLDGNISPLCMERIYKTAIRSRMEYACAVWSGGSVHTGWRSLQRLQDSFTKRLGLTLPPLKNRFNYHTLVLFFKIRQNLAPKYLCTLVPDLSSTTSGYSFRKFSYPVPFTKSQQPWKVFYPELSSYGMTFPLTSNLPRHLSTFKAKLRAGSSLIVTFHPPSALPPPPPTPAVSSLPPSSTLFSQERSSDK